MGRGYFGIRNREYKECKQGHVMTAENTLVWRNHRSCRTCRLESFRSWRKRHRELDTERTREYHETNKTKPGYYEKRREQHRKTLAKYPEKQKARELAHKHKAEIKKTSCENCGAKENLHMHHPDYTKPIDVITLCRQCHVDVHAGFLELGATKTLNKEK